MRVVVLVKATKDSEMGVMPSTELLEAMGKFNEELVNAGIMLAGEGLKPSAQGKRVAFDVPRSSLERVTWRRPTSIEPLRRSSGSSKRDALQPRAWSGTLGSPKSWRRTPL